MTILKVEGEVSKEGVLRIDVPCELPPGPVDVVLKIQPRKHLGESGKPRWAEIYGLGKDVWKGVDPYLYLQELRQDRDSSA